MSLRSRLKSAIGGIKGGISNLASDVSKPFSALRKSPYASMAMGGLFARQKAASDQDVSASAEPQFGLRNAARKVGAGIVNYQDKYQIR